MQASAHELEVLEQLQIVDRERATAQKKFDELPHRQAILELRTKKAEVEAKRSQVQALLDNTEKSLNNLAHEDERLAQKQAEVEQTLQEVQGDYRSVNAHTKELDGLVKRRANVDEQLGEVGEKLTKVKEVMAQVEAGLRDLNAKEAELTESFQKVGGALQQALADTTRTHDQLIAELAPKVRKAYEKALEQCGGIALAKLQDGQCNTCRTSFEFGRITQLQQEAPIATCPACKRLLVVAER